MERRDPSDDAQEPLARSCSCGPEGELSDTLGTSCDRPAMERASVVCALKARLRRRSASNPRWLRLTTHIFERAARANSGGRRPNRRRMGRESGWPPQGPSAATLLLWIQCEDTVATPSRIDPARASRPRGDVSIGPPNQPPPETATGRAPGASSEPPRPRLRRPRCLFPSGPDGRQHVGRPGGYAPRDSLHRSSHRPTRPVSAPPVDLHFPWLSMRGGLSSKARRTSEFSSFPERRSNR